MFAWRNTNYVFFPDGLLKELTISIKYKGSCTKFNISHVNLFNGNSPVVVISLAELNRLKCIAFFHKHLDVNS